MLLNHHFHHRRRCIIIVAVEPFYRSPSSPLDKILCRRFASLLPRLKSFVPSGRMSVLVTYCT